MRTSTRNRSRLAAATFAVALVVTSCGGSDGGGDKAGDTTKPKAGDSGGGGGGGGEVTIKGFKYDPEPASAKVGDTLTFKNDDGSVHTATSEDDAPAKFDTGDIPKGDSADITLEKEGTYKYKCTIHSSMHGTLEVSA